MKRNLEQLLDLSLLSKYPDDDIVEVTITEWREIISKVRSLEKSLMDKTKEPDDFDPTEMLFRMGFLLGSLSRRETREYWTELGVPSDDYDSMLRCLKIFHATTRRVCHV